VNKDLNQLKEFCIEVLQYINQTEPEEISFINDYIKIVTTLKSKTDINSTVSEIVEMSQDYKGSKLDALDEILRSKNLPPLTFMRAKKSRLILSIIDRGAIETDDEFRLLNSYLDDAVGKDTELKTIEAIDALLFEYESNK
jgi:hypothetical protein